MTPPHPERPDVPDGPRAPGEPAAPDGSDGPGDPHTPGGRSASAVPGGRVPPAPQEPAGAKGRGAAEHRALKSLLGAWALTACAPQEAAAVEEHLGECDDCAQEALRLRDAVGLLHRPDSLDLDPGLRARVLDSCLERRPPRVPVPEWAAPYDAETARLDALLQDIGDGEWHAPVRLRWFTDEGAVSRRTTVAGVIAHLLSVDGLVAVALGLEDPLGDLGARSGRFSPPERTEAYWRALYFPPTRSVRAPWREQSRALVRTASLGGADTADLSVSYGDFEIPLPDAGLDRAFECWVHAEDIARAVDYPYEPPAPRHLHEMIDLAARMLPLVLAARRRAGLAPPARHLVAAGEPGRSLRLEIEGQGGGQWLLPLDSPGAVGSAEHEVAHVALDGLEFCRLAAGHLAPHEAAAGQLGDREAIRDVLYATASMSRL
ncbi:hypothetical protein [Streptomyces sp. F-3]|uniref:Zf-HC2 domain-containing protein n=1 Tax=Streptomyces thermogriseus TaxID=75292 RepID=A0ABP4DMX6_9ACTN|nr:MULTISPECIES: maleylpyruvate isomerase N-terminal domain-containing protein [Streptomyces]MDN5382469.1 zf-HC2 domain-containing protein [Streptomyces sp. LB8]GAT82554.1 hypothetical protein [Streptomyces sp. F-3]